MAKATLRVIIMYSLLILLLGACGNEATSLPNVTSIPPPDTVPPTQSATSTPPPPSIDSLSVVSIQELTLPNLVAYLSPDGKRLALLSEKRDELCLFSINGQKEVCATVRSVDLNTLRWSPDSQQIAFTEDFYRNFIEPDIWVMEITSGKLRNLTDDKVDRYRPGTSVDPATQPDVLPRWSKDGSRLLFVRYYNLENNSFKAALHSVSVNGGEVKREAEINNIGFGVYALGWAPDGKSAIYSYGLQRDDPKNGAWLTPLQGTNARQILNVPALEQLPTDYDFSADNRYILAFRLNYDFAVSWEQSFSWILPVQPGGNLKVDAEGRAQWPTWSPAGSGLAYIVRGDGKDESKSGLYLSGQPGGTSRLVLSGKFAAPTTNFRTLTWAANNTILLYRVDDNKHVLVQLGKK